VAKKTVLIGLVVMLLFVSMAVEASYTLEFFPANTLNGIPMGGFLTAVFTDVATNQVDLTITSALTPPGKTGTESVIGSGGLYFNFSPAASVGGLTFTLQSGSFTQGATAVESSAGYTVGNGGSYDIHLTYPGNVFSNGQYQTYLITGTGIDAADFMVANSKNWFAAMGVSVPGGLSTGEWVGATVTVTPEGTGAPIPASVWLFGPGLIGIIGLRRKCLK